ncbi:unnamed protein product [Meloidogyne enterolobii]|uniref:Uncharacterized protein n=1 Tax=Meloidogyne enterolobii TaxID=390850 RepID=A0ACB0YFB5_MELEN
MKICRYWDRKLQLFSVMRWKIARQPFRRPRSQISSFFSLFFSFYSLRII